MPIRRIVRVLLTDSVNFLGFERFALYPLQIIYWSDVTQENTRTQVDKHMDVEIFTWNIGALELLSSKLALVPHSPPHYHPYPWRLSDLSAIGGRG